MTLPAIDPDHLILLFIGSERTGSTLLGQLLNLHPACLIANESRLVAKVIERGVSLDTALHEAAVEAHEQFQVGLEQWGRFSDTNEKSQPRWRPMAGLSRCESLAKAKIHVVGDKKAGAVSQLVIDRPTQVRDFVSGTSRIRMLHLLRDPLASARSACRRGQQPDLETAIEQIAARHAAALRLAETSPSRCIRAHYEQLCAEPDGQLRMIAEWLGLDAPREWLDVCRGLVDAPCAPDGADAALRRRVIERHGLADILDLGAHAA